MPSLYLQLKLDLDGTSKLSGMSSLGRLAGMTVVAGASRLPSGAGAALAAGVGSLPRAINDPEGKLAKINCQNHLIYLNHKLPLAFWTNQFALAE